MERTEERFSLIIMLPKKKNYRNQEVESKRFVIEYDSIKCRVFLLDNLDFWRHQRSNWKFDIQSAAAVAIEGDHRSRYPLEK